jgi:hypothetical protein
MRWGGRGGPKTGRPLIMPMGVVAAPEVGPKVEAPPEETGPEDEEMVGVEEGTRLEVGEMGGLGELLEEPWVPSMHRPRGRLVR